MGGQYHVVKMLGMAIGVHAHAAGVALDAAHGGVQALVGNAAHDLFHVAARAPGHGPPLRAVGDLDEPVVVAEADHGGHRKAQHLVRGAAPDAAQHGQQVPVAEGIAKAVRLQKVAQRLHQRAVHGALGQACAQAVEAQQVRQHAPEARACQVAALGKHGGKAGAAPLQRPAPANAGHLHRERHVRARLRHAQIGKQLQELGVGAFVEDQKPRVHPVGDRAVGAGQRDIDRVGMAAEVGARLEQGDLRPTAQLVRGAQTGNAGTNDGDSHGRPPVPGVGRKKKVAKRPETKKRGREEKRSRVSVTALRQERLRNTKTCAA